MARYPASLLAKYLGVYEARIPGARHAQIVIVMANVLAKAGDLVVHELYDLKGSYVDRRAVTSDPGSFSGIRKDQDLRRLFHLGKPREAMMAQLKVDVGFLSANNLMDYSLLVGVRDIPCFGLCWCRSQGCE